MKFIVIGITDNSQPWFPPEVMEVICSARVCSGGKRHHELVAPLLPDGVRWIDITVPLEKVFEQYKTANSESSDCPSIVVFASGDPLFFGFAVTLQREFPDAEIRVFSAFNSLQLLAHRLVMPYHDMRIVSLTGRPWQEFDRAIIEQAPKIGILTDREHTPAAIARRLLEYGHVAYRMYVGERLGNSREERVTTLTLDEAAEREFCVPNCVILEANHSLTDRKGWGRASAFGLPDSSFAILDGREKMITKMPIRLLTLQALDLPRRHVLWDIGACTGSVSIEARLLFPHLHIVAFEIRPECETIIRENCRRHGAPGIELHIGDFLEYGDGSSSPDAVFIGGHGGRLKDIMAKALTVLAPDGVIVMNSVVAPKVLRDSHKLWDQACRELGLRQEPPLHVQLDDHHPITILKCRR